jgi:hypothetical protein
MAGVGLAYEGAFVFGTMFFCRDDLAGVFPGP